MSNRELDHPPLPPSSKLLKANSYGIPMIVCEGFQCCGEDFDVILSMIAEVEWRIIAENYHSAADDARQDSFNCEYESDRVWNREEKSEQAYENAKSWREWGQKHE